MPWQEQSRMSLRQEFVALASQDGANVRELCRRFGISAKTGYKWLGRAAEAGAAGLVDRSRRPRTSPTKTAAETEERVVALRGAHPTWGGRKIAAWLEQHGVAAAPAPSTITSILARQGRLDGPRAGEPRTYRRFEHATPNALWQLDFMGHKPLRQGRVHPLTVLDDHSRFGLGLIACPHERGRLVQQHLIAVFQAYGLPQAILADHGPPWGAAQPGVLTWLAAWLIRLGIRVYHGRPLHPQTRGKIERWHRTIATDLFQFQPFPDLAATQRAFDRYRTEYNTDRPHDALPDLVVPASRYQPSARPYPKTLPEIAYSEDHTVCRVHQHGTIWFAGRPHFISEALAGLPVGVRPTAVDGVFVVRFCAQAIRRLDLRH